MIFKICIVWEYQVFEQIYEETQADIESNDDCNLESGANESSNIALNESSTIEDFPDLRTLNRELNRYLDLTDALQFSNPIENITLGDCALNTWQQDNNYYSDEQEFDFIYDLSMERQKIKELKINFGSSDITRFSN